MEQETLLYGSGAEIRKSRPCLGGAGSDAVDVLLLMARSGEVLGVSVCHNGRLPNAKTEPSSRCISQPSPSAS